jgi:DNA-binding LacI/PurR family transcriptional regulator
MSKDTRPSLKDVAAAAGVSPSVVSAVVNGRVGGKIRASEETKERIRRAVADLGYSPHPIARRLAGGRNYLVAVFTYESIFPFEHRDFYYPFLLGIEREAERRGYDILLVTRRSRCRDCAGGESALGRLRIADGAILFGLSRDEEEIASLAESGYPLVSIGRREFVRTSKVACVAGDYVRATEDVVSHLVRYGHRRIVYLRVREDNEPSSDREAGFLSGIAASPQVEGTVRRCSPEAIDAALLAELRSSGTTAVVAERYAIAEALSRVAGREGLAFPRDLSVAVLGGPKEAGEPSRDWTGFAVPDQEMGTSAAAALISRIEGDEGGPSSLVVPCPFIRGDSIGPAQGPERPA